MVIRTRESSSAHGRIVTVAMAAFIGMSLVAASCTPPAGPAPQSWVVRPVSIQVLDQEDYDAGDEPYVIQVGFQSKVGVAGSTAVTVASQCRSGKLPPTDIGGTNTVVPVPPGSADIRFNDVKNLDVGDLAFGFAPIEILGTISFVVERDGILPTCVVTDALDNSLRPLLSDALDLFVASQPIPPTTDQLIALITDNLGIVLTFLLGLIGAVIEGLGNPDDVIGVATQIHLATGGVLTSLLQGAFQLAGMFDPNLAAGILPIDALGSSLKIQVGQLTPSEVSIPLAYPDVSYVYRTSVVPG